VLHELVDLAFEIGDRVKGAAADGLSRDQHQPALDRVQPGAIGRRAVQVKSRPTRQLGSYPDVLVRAGVVADQMHVEMLRHVRFDVSQECQELLMTVLGLALREQSAVGHIERLTQALLVRHTAPRHGRAGSDTTRRCRAPARSRTGRSTARSHRPGCGAPPRCGFRRPPAAGSSAHDAAAGRLCEQAIDSKLSAGPAP